MNGHDGRQSEATFPVLDPDLRKAIGHALGRIPQGLYIMTARHEHRVRGVMVSWVQQASFEPPMVIVALGKGREIIPLIHDSHSFALCQVAEDDRLILKKFAEGRKSNRVVDEDPFQGLEITRRCTGSPILTKSLSFLDCDLVRHLDIEGDHDLYVGLVRDGGPLVGGEATIRMRENGFRY